MFHTSSRPVKDDPPSSSHHQQSCAGETCLLGSCHGYLPLAGCKLGLDVSDSRLDGVFRQHAAVQLDRGQAEVLGDVTAGQEEEGGFSMRAVQPS
jgi:hypothetical protein